ncbi:LysE family translocator [Photobacterium sp. 1_MG-2023]|uniref:LysE family translocator n=1 Tax=Photobacterium sp. 1_MG-2023 TaxID=3062646 RepID=UPI0026E1CA4D|nr:LysE family translocator [Photobacterium sp. 1_MG-2023]MDO6706998.1 LysE family translocator [Photobacterium sp. 1_MG-2023]
MDLQTLFLFALASISLNLVPGPDVIYIVSNAMRGKMRSGIQAALGLGVGYMGHTFAAVLGLSALILNSALLFSVVKYLGAAYLLYLGISSIRNSLNGKSRLIAAESISQSSNVFKQGVIVSILNPKVGLFFLSFLPQFIDVQAGNVTMQLMILGCVFSVLATVINLLYAMLGSFVFGNPKMSGYTKAIEGVSGGLLVALGAKIALTQR